MEPIIWASRNDVSISHPGIESVTDLVRAHDSKIYFSGRLKQRIEYSEDGPHLGEIGWTHIWAQLSGTTLSVWDMAAVESASLEGRQEFPECIDVTESVGYTFQEKPS